MTSNSCSSWMLVSQLAGSSIRTEFRRSCASGWRLLFDSRTETATPVVAEEALRI